MYLNEEIKVATRVVAVGYLFNVLHCLHKLCDIVVRVLFEADVAPYYDIIAHFVTICECGNKLTEAQQWAKLALVQEIAKEVWK